jgi:hypothetical protein
MMLTTAPNRPALVEALATPQTARIRWRFGRRVSLRAEAAITPAGLLATGALVAAVLLAIPPIIRAARPDK